MHMFSDSAMDVPPHGSMRGAASGAAGVSGEEAFPLGLTR